MSPDARREFFESGEDDVDRLFLLIGDVACADALDFGCGVGRMTLALARRVERVVGVDIAPRMLTLARQNAVEAGIANAVFVDQIPDQHFDLIVSLIVFQHVPVARGMQLLGSLLERLRPGGVAALHFTLARAGGWVRRALRPIRANVPLVHWIASRLEGNPHALPYMQMNEYDLAAIRSELDRAGCRETKLEPTNHGGVEGVIVVARR
jgi:2-polyprenyl-3-methyl-5-hydroxy-6-metoxy-1,4-benzoquinol methylase